MERMSALDAGFWDMEDEHAALHIGAVAVFEGPAPSASEIAALYARRVQECPRYRQRMRRARLRLRRPAWVDDPAFDLAYHLRRTALPAPGEKPELDRLVGRLMSTHLDEHRPLWEAWVIEGLDGDRWALLVKLHHSMVDGIGGMTLFTTLLDMPGRESNSRPPSEEPARTGALSPVAAIAARLGFIRTIVRDVEEVARNPVGTARTGVAGLRSARSLARTLRPTVATSLNGRLGTPRRYRTVSVEIEEITRVREALGGTVNDVALAMIARGFRELLTARGERCTEHTVRSMVPVSVRGSAERNEVANHVAVLLVDLPVSVPDPFDAYRALITSTRSAKASGAASAGRTGFSIADHLPAPVAAGFFSALGKFPQRIVTTVTTNVPGPPATAYLLGRRMLALYPYVPIAAHVRVGIAITSYDGLVHFGITCDRDSVPDADVLTAGMTTGLGELTKLAMENEPH
ncbi:MAG TPA: wax ester/triacylglycerol synthase family O-acyltransferase [Jatrophihabitans sp.]|jgi:diacylglycerol O-acyltransferase|nr:wax ester/triacylglycerol synthase family O-acyltransferase [Jatrophihabitans sp.]